jgi:hypothetical protein
MIEPLTESLIWVITGANFWAYATTILCIGMVFGWVQNKGMSGFQRSFYTLLPLVGIYFLSSANRVIEYAQVYGYGAQSFNNLVNIVLVAGLYILGLFIGHLIKHKAVESAVKNSNLPESKKQEVTEQLNASI